MESVPINDILQEEITKLQHTLIPPEFDGDVHTLRWVQDCLSKAIDKFGEQSARAQGLTKVITTTERLRSTSANTLYVLKDANLNGGKGDLIGMLKVGRKHLYLYDENAKMREVEPLCVLDFFVLPNRQRHGLGRKLFDYMLQDMSVDVHELAVDGPSPKMEQFLIKNYGIEKLIRQSNNFAVTPEFFGRKDTTISAASGSGIPNNMEPQRTPEPVMISESRSEAEAMPACESAPKTQAQQVMPPARPSSLRVDTTPAAGMPSISPSGLDHHDSQLTNRGFFNIKFYHNRLW